MTNRKKRRIMRSFKMEEISAVDRPAQEGAQMAIMKREDAAIAIKSLDDEGRVQTEYATVGELLETLHDSVPNADKSAVARLISKQEADESPEAMAREMLERASGQLDRMVSAFMDASGAERESAEEAVMGSRVGRRIAALIGAAERMLSDDLDAEDREATRRADVARMRASVGGPGADTTKTRDDEMTAEGRALDARESTDDELDRLAKARAASHGTDFYTAYEHVCGTDEGLALMRKRDAFHAFAVGGVEHGRGVDTLAKTFDEDAAGRRTDLYKAQQVSLDAGSADRALLKRARAVQVERGVHLLAAIEVAKAERPELARAASI